MKTISIRKEREAWLDGFDVRIKHRAASNDMRGRLQCFAQG